ncbi:MAG: rRNA maturation RNase YbeY [Sphingomonadales bacterium]|nr:rRNA maturation RNase YbeY [Sphingomonadales bacterium]
MRVFNRQRKVRVARGLLEKRGLLAMPWVLEKKKRPDVPLAALEMVEVSVVSDAAIARVHGEFLMIRRPTDVITFDHGEILVSAETAQENAMRYGQSVDDELTLYLIHGLLHLAGWEDHDSVEAAEMARQQEEVLSRCDRFDFSRKNRLSFKRCPLDSAPHA